MGVTADRVAHPSQAPRVEVGRTGSGTVVASLLGEHDLTTTDQLERALAALVDEGKPVTVDLSEVAFVDSSILHVLVSMHESARHGGGLLVELGGNRSVENVLRVTGLLERLVGGAAGALDMAPRRNGDAPGSKALSQDGQTGDDPMPLAAERVSAVEQARLAAVRRFEILDTPPDGSFDRVTALAARLFAVPIAIVSVVDQDRIWFKSHHGTDVPELPRDLGLCASAILQDGPYIVTDAACDPRTLANPLVAGEFGLRFYAAVPLTVRGGHSLGTLCVLDHDPRTVTEEETETLQDLADVVVDQLELRLEARLTVKREARLRAEAVRLADALQQSLLPPHLPHIPRVELCARYRPIGPGVVGGDFYDVFPTHGDRWIVVLGDVAGKGPEAATLTGLVRSSVRTAALATRSPGEILECVNETLLLRRADEDPARFCTLAVAELTTSDDCVRLRVARGGHPPILVVRRDGRIDEPGASGPIVGCFEHATFRSREILLAPGDLAVFYTDGLPDARDGAQPLGEHRLRELLTNCTGCGPGETVDRLLTAVTRLEPGPRDDIAVLTLRPDREARPGGSRSSRTKAGRPASEATSGL